MVTFEFIFFENISIPVPNAGVDKCLLLAKTCESKSETECMWTHLEMDFGSFRKKRIKAADNVTYTRSVEMYKYFLIFTGVDQNFCEGRFVLPVIPHTLCKLPMLF